MTARAFYRTQRWQTAALASSAIVAVVIGTVANGFLGQQWFFNADNIVDALPLGLPFLVAAGVVAGQDRWPAGRTWLIAGAWLLAIDGALAVLLEIQVALLEREVNAFQGAEPWFVVRGISSALAQIGGFAILAAGLWLTRPTEWGVVQRRVAIGLTAVLAVAAIGPFAALNLIPSIPDSSDPNLAIVLLGQVTFTLGLLALGALAIAGIRAAPPLRPFPELLIATGAAASTIATGITWWVFYTSPDFNVFAALSAVAQIGLLVVAAGFWSGAMFWPADDDRSVTEAQPSA